MRIKMQCPDCGKWFTLQLSVKEASENHGHAVTAGAEPGGRGGVDPVRRTESVRSVEATPGARRPLLSRLAPVLAVAAIVLLWFFAIGPAIERSRTALVDESGAAVASAVEESREPVETPENATTTDSRERSATADVSEPTAEIEEGGPSTAASAPVVASAPGELELTLVAAERCWVRVVSDGRVASDLTMQAGERRTWKAERDFRLDVGSGEDVQIILNGEYLGPAGAGPRVVEGLYVTVDGLSSRA